jgi:hypothetical protein
MKQEQKTRIANICYAVVSDNFAMFCNPKYRGENFTWDKFVDMQADKCRLQVKLQTPESKDPKKDKEIEDLAEKFGREIALKMVTVAGFINKESANHE